MEADSKSGQRKFHLVWGWVQGNKAGGGSGSFRSKARSVQEQQLNTAIGKWG